MPTVPRGLFESNFVFLTFCLTTFRLAIHMSAILAHFGPKMTNSTMLGLVTSLKMMVVVGVLIFADPQSAPPSENLTIPCILVLQDQVCCSDEFQFPLECWELMTCESSFCFLKLRSLP